MLDAPRGIGVWRARTLGLRTGGELTGRRVGRRVRDRGVRAAAGQLQNEHAHKWAETNDPEQAHRDSPASRRQPATGATPSRRSTRARCGEGTLGRGEAPSLALMSGKPARDTFAGKHHRGRQGRRYLRLVRLTSQAAPNLSMSLLVIGTACDLLSQSCHWRHGRAPWPGQCPGRAGRREATQARGARAELSAVGFGSDSWHTSADGWRCRDRAVIVGTVPASAATMPPGSFNSLPERCCSEPMEAGPRLCRRGAPRDQLFRAFPAEIDSMGTLTVALLEDMHWADGATIDLLGFLGRRRCSPRARPTGRSSSACSFPSGRSTTTSRRSCPRSASHRARRRSGRPPVWASGPASAPPNLGTPPANVGTSPAKLGSSPD